MAEIKYEGITSDNKYKVKFDLFTQSYDEITRKTPNNGTYIINAQEFIHVSHDRLCTKASSETRAVWECVVEEMFKIEPLLASMAVPHCVFCGYCKEYKSCGMSQDAHKRHDYLWFINGRD